MYSKVFILILNWNGEKDIIECLSSLEKINYPDYEIIIIDNASTDNSPQLIREKFPDLKIIYNHKNLGFAEGMNVGIREVRGQRSEVRSHKLAWEKSEVRSDYYVLLLNQDVVVEPDFLKKLVQVAELDSKIGIVGPKIYYHLPSKLVSSLIWSCGTKFVSGSAFRMKIPYANSSLIGCGELDKGQYDKLTRLRRVDALVGCCMLIKSDVISQIGFLDSYFFLIHEDDDYCIRAKKAGYKVCIVPESIIWHKVSTSLGYYEFGSGDPNLPVIYYWYRNWFFILSKHFSTKIFLKVIIAYTLRIMPKELWKLFQSKYFVPLHSYLFALIDALKYKLKLVAHLKNT